MSNKTKVLHQNEWLSLKSVISEYGDEYIFSHETRMGGKSVAVLVFDSSKPKKVLLRYEIVPCHFDGPEPKIVAVTGGAEYPETPAQSALRELEEETGFTATEKEMIPLGIVRPSKSADTITHLFAVDVKGKKQGKPEGDGSEGEKTAYVKFGTIEEAINCKDPLMATMIVRLMSRANPKKIKEF